MDWKKLIQELIAAGMTQVQIAAECGVSQSSVSDLFRGASKSPSYDFGKKLEALAEARRLSKEAEATGVGTASGERATAAATTERRHPENQGTVIPPERRRHGDLEREHARAASDHFFGSQER